MVDPMRNLGRIPASFVAALIVSVAAAATMPTLDYDCHNRTADLGGIDHGDVAVGFIILVALNMN